MAACAKWRYLGVMTCNVVSHSPTAPCYQDGTDNHCKCWDQNWDEDEIVILLLLNFESLQKKCSLRNIFGKWFIISVIYIKQKLNLLIFSGETFIILVKLTTWVFWTKKIYIMSTYDVNKVTKAKKVLVESHFMNVKCSILTWRLFLSSVTSPGLPK